MSDVQTEMIPTQCALCLTQAHDRELYPANFDAGDLSAEVFSARRLPDRVHYRMVTCRQCGLVRSDPVASEQDLAQLYAQSRFTYEEESVWAARTYAKYFGDYLHGLSKQARVLEIGCGNGSFMQELFRQGYANLAGIEPSREAISRAGAMQGLIHQGMFSAGIYPPQHFDAVTAFQVFDHVRDPNRFLQDCAAALKPGGKLFLAVHDIGAWSARLLGRSCPMIDIEHPFLYNKKTLKAILSAAGFSPVRIFTINNRYPLKYWGRLLPAPAAVKNRLLRFLERSPIGQVPVLLSAGNIGAVAVKPE